MRKTSVPHNRRVRIRLQIGDPVLERQANIAYGTYVLKAIHRFDLEDDNVPNKPGRTNQPKAGGARRSREI